jgi:phenylpyruvate tautomerase PptA (4-oxalocrotonate tautomerase family)
MPIVTIQIVCAERNEIPKERVQALADALGALFESRDGETWVRMSYLPQAHYAENGTARGPEIQPTFVEVIKGSLPAQEALAAEASRIAEVVAEQLSRPKANTHVLYQPAGIGRIAFGGNLVRG